MRMPAVYCSCILVIVNPFRSLVRPSRQCEDEIVEEVNPRRTMIDQFHQRCLHVGDNDGARCRCVRVLLHFVSQLVRVDRYPDVRLPPNPGEQNKNRNFSNAIANKTKFKKSEFTMEVGGWVQVSIGIFLNHHKIALSQY